uniref:Uncharacterized protein n=1 Tax=Sphaerodactylus townsendi TaxID=933632 RepID=A0ACB8FBX1_9SAUR
MAAVYLGARGSTAEQIAEVFHFKKAGRTGGRRTITRQAYSNMEELLYNPCISIQKTPLNITNNIHSGFGNSGNRNQPSKTSC